MKHDEFRVPDAFYLFGQKISVVWSDDLASSRQAWGEAQYAANRIVLQKPTQAIARSQSDIEQTYCHELVHYLLTMAERTKLAQDEGLVNLLGNLLHQALTTAEYGGKK